MKRIFIIIAIIVLTSIAIFVHNRKNVSNGFTGTIYTINYCDERNHCDEIITIDKKIPNSIKQFNSWETAIKIQIIKQRYNLMYF